MTPTELFEKYKYLYHFEEGDPSYLIDEEDFKKSLKQYAEQEVKNALESAAELAETEDYEEYQYGGGYKTFQRVDKGSILNAYKVPD